MFDELTQIVTGNAWAIEVFIIVFGTGVVRYVAKVVLDRLAVKFEQTKNLYDDALLEAIRRPLGLGIWVLGISWAAEIVGGEAQAEIFDQVDVVRDVAVGRQPIASGADALEDMRLIEDIWRQLA